MFFSYRMNSFAFVNTSNVYISIFIIFISSISICNQIDYDIVFNLQRTHFANVSIQSLFFVAFDVSVTFFPVYTSSDASFYSADSLYQRFELDPRIKPTIMGPFQISSIQAQYSGNSNRPSKWKNEKIIILYRMFSIRTLFRSSI